MTVEENIQNRLIGRFDFLKDSVKINRQRRISVSVPYDKFDEVFRFVVVEEGFSILCTITGLDEGNDLSLFYHLSQETGAVLNLKTSVPKVRPMVKTITGVFPAAEIYEREIVDLLGLNVEGLLSANRYPLTDDWPEGEYPLRKDWKSKEGQEVKENE